MRVRNDVCRDHLIIPVILVTYFIHNKQNSYQNQGHAVRRSLSAVVDRSLYFFQDIPNPEGDEAPEKPSKEEYAVAKWIRSNVPSKKTKFLNHNVQYFTGTRAVDALLEKSPWNKTMFESREQITSFLDVMLRHKFFHRAKKVVLSEQELSKIRGAKKKGKDSGKPEIKEEKKSIEKEESKERESADAKDAETDKQEEKKELKKKPKVFNPVTDSSFLGFICLLKILFSLGTPGDAFGPVFRRQQ